jgi:hypothetical protein
LARSNSRTRLLVWLPGDASSLFGGALAPEGNWIAPAREFLTRSLDGLRWLRERYPELNAKGEPRRSMAQFGLVLCLHNALIEHRSLVFFAGPAPAWRRRLAPAPRRGAGRHARRLRCSRARRPGERTFVRELVGEPGSVAAVLQQGRTAL